MNNRTSKTGTFVKFRGKLYNPQDFANRDLSWLDFNHRVLNEALDSRTPLLERLRFIDIFRSNVDEFFMKRVGSLQQKILKDSRLPYIDGIGFEDLYERIRERIEADLYTLDQTFALEILPRLQDYGFQYIQWQELARTEKMELKKYFFLNIFPILTPLAVDSGHPFPFLSNLSKSIALCIRKPRGKKKHFARVKIPHELPQWIPLKATAEHRYRFINIEEIISNNLNELFEGMIIEDVMLFRVTRNAAIEGEEDEIEDIMEMVEDDLKIRKFAPIVRLEYRESKNPWLIKYLKEELSLTEDKIWPVHTFLFHTNFGPIINLSLPQLKYPPFIGKTSKNFTSDKIFNQLAHKETIQHFPYDRYSESVEYFLHAAAEDPQVKAIKMTVYRTDEDGRLIDLLVRAAENKKQVACIVELTARFDEERNIKWAQTLEEAGIHVSYGLTDYKTHAKMILVIRQEGNKLRSYLNVGTGNYNASTSKLYTDLSFFTTNTELTAEAIHVFNYLTGRSLKATYKHLLVAPFNMHKKFIALINNEIIHAKNDRPAEIIAKMNSLEDPDIIQALYRAASHNVKIKLIVRGFCTLKKQKNIEVYSIVGRLLEHSRLYYFRNGQTDQVDGNFYLGSADLMHRNLHDRVEVITPIKSRSLRKKLLKILQVSLSDNRHLWELQENGEYVQRCPGPNDIEINSQQIFINGLKDADLNY